MALIKSTGHAVPSPATEKPPMPALQSICYWLAGAIVILTIASWKLIEKPHHVSPENFFVTQIMTTAGGLLAAIFLFGFGQVIGYLGQTAYYARRLYETSQNNQDSG